MKQQGKPIKQVVHTEVQQWSGPIPAPESLAKYDAIVPGAAKQLIEMAEKEQQHRHKMEEGTLKRNNRLAVISTIFAFVCVILLIGLVVFAICYGAYGAALAAIISAIATVAGVFGIGKFLRTREK